MIPAAFVQDLLTRVDIAEVVGRHVELKKAGINLKGLCPFHGEKTPSFIVSPTRQTYHCFGCGVHGDAIRFLIEHAGLSFPDAVAELASQTGLTVPQEPRSEAENAQRAAEREQRAGLAELMTQAGAHYRKQLKNSPRAIDYLKGRGLSGAIAARFALGYAPEGWRGLASVFPHYDDAGLVEAGLVIVHEDDDGQGRRYDRFRDRIMFPIRSLKGEVIGFGGRVLDRGEPKYLNSPETPLFSKGQELYGLHEARQAIRAAGSALVVEGYMDVVALAQAGIGHAVATLGTACTDEHVRKLFRHTDTIVFAFDGDAAGRKAAARALQAVLPHLGDTRSARFLFLPTEHDPDSFVRQHGRQAFETAAREAMPASRLMLESASEGLDMSVAEERAKMLARARPLWSSLPAGLLRAQLLSSLAERGQISSEVLRSTWGEGDRPGADAAADGPFGAAPPLTARQRQRPRTATRAAATLLDRAGWLLLRHPALWETMAAGDHAMLAEQPSPHGELFCELERVWHDEGAWAPGGPALESSTLEALVQRIQSLHDVDDEANAADQLEAVLSRLRQQAVEDELATLMSASELPPEDRARRQELLARRAELKLARPAEGAG